MRDGYIQKILPDPALRDYIRQYTFVDLPYEATRSLEMKVLPSSHTRMILFFSQPSLHENKNNWQPVDRYSLTGFLSQPQLFVPRSRVQQVMIHFTPWGVQPLLDFPLSDITDTRADLNQVFKNDLENLCENLHLGMGAGEKAFALNVYFKNKLGRARPLDDRARPLAEYILESNGVLRLHEVTKKFFIGERTAQRLIHNAVGINYKFFARLARLEHVRKLISQPRVSLTDVALQAGYFDQAHFIHDFQEAFGESPGAYLKKQQRLVWNRIV